MTVRLERRPRLFQPLGDVWAPGDAAEFDGGTSSPGAWRSGAWRLRLRTAHATHQSPGDNWRGSGPGRGLYAGTSRSVPLTVASQ
jgi:hypothetical protein